ncbi:LytR/AlgR family response regulator transcription factor [Spirosoma aerolatum]|uniref:LytR/AlgR family response regulator transcription factor n=1 Tax=Spirosoma aerolatum TaxID=1211326 RepID=UPI0009AF1F48|nr:LytTR family DNA-binding domain-containing protein [Spirosoma aerolatum]
MISSADQITHSIKIPGYSEPVLLNTIVRLQGESNYTWLHLQASKRPMLIAKNLKWFEEMLPDFVRVHKSDLINPSFVQKYDYANATTLEVSLPNQQTIRVSRRRIDPVLLKLRHHRSSLH